MGHLKILVAEDSGLRRRIVISSRLAELGWAHDIAQHGQEALLRWRADPSRYWLLLTDLQMPEYDGFALARCIRGHSSAGARLPIVAFTSGADLDDAARWRRAGIDECLARPAELTQLREALQRWRPRPPVAAAPRPCLQPRLAHALA